MKTIIRTAIKYKKITLMVLAILLLMGMYSYYIMPRQEFPEINAPVALVTVQYSGASPEDIESLVTSKVEERHHQVLVSQSYILFNSVLSQHFFLLGSYPLNNKIRIFLKSLFSRFFF